MARPTERGSDDDEPRGSKHRGRDESSEDDQPEYEHEKPSRRRKSNKKSKAKESSEDEGTDDDEEEEASKKHKQIATRKKSKKAKSSGKELARRKKESSSESSEEEPEPKPKRDKKKKKKTQDDETITIAMWEPIHRNDVDMDFIRLMERELKVSEEKIYHWIEKNYIRRHTQDGKYDISRLFEKQELAGRDKKRWETAVAKVMGDPARKRILFNSKKTGETTLTTGHVAASMGPNMLTIGMGGGHKGQARASA